MSVSSSNPKTYGIKAVKDMRLKPALPVVSNSRLGNKIMSTQDYFLREVDPLIEECIAHLLINQPTTVKQAMLDYLMAKMLDTEDSDAPIEVPENGEEEDKPKVDMKLYLAYRVGPILTRLIHRIATHRPKPVVNFLCNELSTMVAEGEDEVVIPDKVEEGVNKQHLPKEKLDHAIELAEQLSAPAPAASGTELTLAREILILMLGNGGAGKTSVINALEGFGEGTVRPTIGFRPVPVQLDEETTLKFYDVGGSAKIRGIWDQYYHDIYCVIYVFDAACSDDEFVESVSLFNSTMAHPLLAGKPLLILANKKDLPEARPLEVIEKEIKSVVDINFSGVFRSISSSAVPYNFGSDAEPTTDRNIEEGLLWIVDTVKAQYDTLHERVLADTTVKNKQDLLKRLERERKVLKNKIASAFSSSITPELMPPDLAEPLKDDFLQPHDGIEFLASEIGEQVIALPQIARHVAAMIGYQRLALTMVGSLKVPISKKKAPMTWEEILDIITGVRNELGLETPSL